MPFSTNALLLILISKIHQSRRSSYTKKQLVMHVKHVINPLPNETILDLPKLEACTN